MSHHHHHSDSHRPHEVSFAPFLFWTALQVVAAFLLFRFAFPEAFFAEIRQPAAILAWTVVFGLPLSLFEYLYHRYLLHSAVLPFLGSMHRAHSHHHGLTKVKAPVTPKTPDKLVTVESDYPIEFEHQAESMMFPTYSISIFFALFLAVLALPFKLLLPGAPIVTSVLITVTFSYSLYEAWHAVMHLPMDRFWGKLLHHKRIGRVAKHVYSFHLMHHWRPTCNLAVVGFWGFAIWDHLFRTHRRPRRLPVDGAEVSYTDVSLRQPLWPIRMLDKVGARLYKGSRKVEDFFRRALLRRTARG